MHIQDALKEALRSSTHLKSLWEVMDYAVFPAGKLFRPRLVESLSLDLGKDTDHLHLAAAIELHHAYTLVHDDLPSMDNDEMRRGKPSTHKQYGEWKAILAGDALLVASFHELHKIRHSRAHEVFQLFSWATGGKGLIAGQFLDLDTSKPKTFDDIIRVHELKTARLIQVATLGSYLLSSKRAHGRDFFRLGREIGIIFQLLDDLSELKGSVSNHEKEINLFHLAPREADQRLKSTQESLARILKRHNLKHTQNLLIETKMITSSAST